MKLTQYIHVLGNSNFRLYLLKGHRSIILEAGVSGVVPAVLEQLKDKGCQDISNVVVMHAHFDHVCGLPALKAALPRMATAASPQAKKVLAKKKVVASFFEEDSALAPGRQEACDPSFPAGAFEVPETLEIETTVEDGESWHLGGQLEVIFMRAPGHSPCSMAAFCPGQEVLFVSDSTGFQIDDKELFPIFFEGYQPYLETIKRLSLLCPEVVAVAHEDIVQGRKKVKSYLKLAASCAEQAGEYIGGLLRQGKTGEEVSREVFNRYYRGRLRLYSEKNIKMCSDILTRRVREYYCL